MSMLNTVHTFPPDLLKVRLTLSSHLRLSHPSGLFPSAKQQDHGGPNVTQDVREVWNDVAHLMFERGGYRSIKAATRKLVQGISSPGTIQLVGATNVWTQAPGIQEGLARTSTKLCLLYEEKRRNSITDVVRHVILKTLLDCSRQSLCIYTPVLNSDTLGLNFSHKMTNYVWTIMWKKFSY
jgi:hypothetical protein